MLICKLWLSCRDAEEQSCFCEAELLKLSAQPADLLAASAAHAPHMHLIVLLSTSSPHIPQPSCFSETCQLPVFSAALRPFLPQQTSPFMSRCLLPPSSSLKGCMNSAKPSAPFSQKGAPSPTKRDNPRDSHYCLFLSQRVTKFQCSKAGEGLTSPFFESPWKKHMWNTLPLREGWRNIYTFPPAHAWEGRSLKTAAKVVKECIFQSTCNSGRFSNLFANYLKIYNYSKE